MDILHVNEENFDKVIQSGTVIADFWAPWCGPCRMLAPVLEELAEDLPEIRIIKINTDDEINLAKRFGLTSIPTLLLFKDGELIKKTMGYREKDALKEELGL